MIWFEWQIDGLSMQFDYRKIAPTLRLFRQDRYYVNDCEPKRARKCERQTHRETEGDSQAYQCECKSDMRYMIVYRCLNIARWLPSRRVSFHLEFRFRCRCCCSALYVHIILMGITVILLCHSHTESCSKQSMRLLNDYD